MRHLDDIMGDHELGERRVYLDCVGAPRMECYHWHIGTYEYALAEFILKHRDYLQRCFRQVAAALRAAQAARASVLSVGVFCKFGCHRSVGIAYLLRVALIASGVEAPPPEPLSKPQWSRTVCF